MIWRHVRLPGTVVRYYCATSAAAVVGNGQGAVSVAADASATVTCRPLLASPTQRSASTLASCCCVLLLHHLKDFWRAPAHRVCDVRAAVLCSCNGSPGGSQRLEAQVSCMLAFTVQKGTRHALPARHVFQCCVGSPCGVSKILCKLHGQCAWYDGSFMRKSLDRRTIMLQKPWSWVCWRPKGPVA
jgi:hypothetical protein